MRTQTLFDLGTPPQFGGEVDPILDTPRLTKHLAKVKEIMSDGKWITLRELADRVGCSETSASARLRDLRKPFCGSQTVEKRRVGDGGHYEYRVKENA